MFATHNRTSQPPSVELRPFDRLTLAFIGVGVIFACLGMGEAVYRLLFLEFDGATDRLPIEMAFGLAFAWVATKLARRIYQHRLEASVRINTVWDRNHKIRHALQAIAPTYDHDDPRLAIDYVRKAMRWGFWAILIFHDVLPKRLGDGDTSIASHTLILDWIRTQPVWCAPMGQVLDHITGQAA